MLLDAQGEEAAAREAQANAQTAADKLAVPEEEAANATSAKLDEIHEQLLSLSKTEIRQNISKALFSAAVTADSTFQNDVGDLCEVMVEKSWPRMRKQQQALAVALAQAKKAIQAQ